MKAQETVTKTGINELNARQLVDFITLLEGHIDNVWRVAQNPMDEKGNPIDVERKDRKRYSHLREITTQECLLLKKAKSRLELVNNANTISGKSINQLNYIN